MDQTMNSNDAAYQEFDVEVLKNLNLDPEYIKKLEIIEIGALNGEMIDKTEHFDAFFPSIKEFLYKAIEYSKKPNKTLDMDFLNYGIQVQEELGIEKEAMAAILPFYNSLDSRTGRDWRNVFPITLLPAVLGAMGACLINPNLVTSKYGKRANELEVRVVKSLAKILGYTDLEKVSGLAIEGGTKGNMYGYLLGLNKAFPDIRENGLMGVKQEFKFINSQSGHFSNFTTLAAIGVGRKNAFRIPCDEHNVINIKIFKETLEDCVKKNIIVPTVLITIGTTDACSLDNIKEVHGVIEEFAEKYPDMHRPHLHVDAAIGWAFSFYNNYDLEKNKLHFRESMIEKLAHVQSVCQSFHLADSITLDVHKTGFAPYSSSFVIIKNKDDFKTLTWDSGDFKYFNPAEFMISPVSYSLECTRSSSGVFATSMALKSLGIEGYQTLLGAGLQYTEILKEKFAELKNVAVVNPNLGFTCLFRPYPSFVNNAETLIEKEKFSEDFQLGSKEITEYVKGLFKYWKNHKSPNIPNVDYIASAAWGQYGDGDYEIPSWKAYILNPRAGKYIDAFIKEFLDIRNEYEHHLPKEYLEKLKSIF
ncbi:MAG: aspartate aminotransferase family protein [Candidatus Caenarcaniphilales bacterium]|nr:aspartate aminotransferase family protein [Candidatus Caenarcaniphilales bacterium]